MSTQDTRAPRTQAIDRLTPEGPAPKQPTPVMSVELRGGGGDPPIWRVELPGPSIQKDPAADARVDVSIGRPEFNELAAKGHLKDWATAYERGHVRATGDE